MLIHGDAAFAGQGVVMELFQMSQARGFAVGGTVHIVINNQVGFTTSERQDARSTLYCTDVAKMVGAPVLHVNGDDPEAVVFCAELALDFRNRFGKDVVIDLVCYRRHGHNEADEPAATQPRMYQVIRKHKTPRALYAERLIAEGVITEAEAQALVDAYREKLDEGEVTTELVEVKPDEFTVDWTRFLKGKLGDAVDTSFPRMELDRLAMAINTIPEGTTLHAARGQDLRGPPQDGGRQAAAPTGASPRTWPTPRCWPRATACGWSARTAAAARSSTATRSCTTRTATRPTCRCASW